MIRVDEINGLLGLVGFKDSLISEYAGKLDAENLASSSGLFVNDISGLITVKNIIQSIENPSLSNAEFNTYLKDRMKSSFINLIKAIYSDNDMIENKPLFQYENDFNNLITDSQDFVGYEINVAKSKDINVVLNRIMLTFANDGEIDVLLFHSSKDSAYSSKTIQTEQDSEVSEFVNWNLPNSNSITGGKFYIGYLRPGDGENEAYNREYQNSSVQSSYNCLSVTPIIVKGYTDDTLFDVNDIEYSSKTWGMNFDFSSFKDYTSIVTNNRDRFARGLTLQVAADILNLIATSTNINKDERMIKIDALYDLNGNRSNPEIPYSVGVLNQLKNEIKELKKIINQPVIQTNTLS